MKTTRTLTIIFILSFLAAISFTGCKKKEVSPTQNGNNTDETAPASDNTNYKMYAPEESVDSESAPSTISKGEHLHRSNSPVMKYKDSKDGGYYPAPSKPHGDYDSGEDSWDDPSQPGQPENTEEYSEYNINKFKSVLENPLSTFAIDVDSASYTIMRQKINSGQLPPAKSVRVEEYLNYFNYAYPEPSAGKFAVYSEICQNPYNGGKTALLRIALQAMNITKENRRTAHLVFMVDVSGSMGSSNKLPLVKKSLKILVNNLNERDTVAISTYANGSKILLNPTAIDNKDQILSVIDGLRSAGSTNGEAGLRNAYALADKGFVKGHINRIIMCTDGDFNVGMIDGKSLNQAVNKYTKKGITFSAFGFGMGNYKDHRIETLADAGNGNYFYIDEIKEAKRVLETNIGSTLDVVAADVKIQLEFNPALVNEYRLMGYENRALKDEQFRDDLVDAGEVGAGHSVTAVYELKFFENKQDVEVPKALIGKAGMFKIRYKNSVTDEKAVEVNFPVENRILEFGSATKSFKFAAAVAGFADIVRGSEFAEGWRLTTALDCAEAGVVNPKSESDEFVALVKKAISFRDK